MVKIIGYSYCKKAIRELVASLTGWKLDGLRNNFHSPEEDSLCGRPECRTVLPVKLMTHHSIDHIY